MKFYVFFLLFNKNIYVLCYIILFCCPGENVKILNKTKYRSNERLTEI